MTRFRSDAARVAELRAAELRAAGLRAAELRVAERRRYWVMSGGKRAKLVSASAALLVAALISAAAHAAPQVGVRVALTACPQAGTTAPCLIVNGSDGTVYNITGATPKPPFNGRMIRLRATVSDKLSACLQGIVLERIRWTPVRQKCTN